MITFVLGASIGLPLHTRVCRMPDMPTKTSVFMADIEDCCQKNIHQHCEKEQEKPFNPCCKFTDNFLQVDFDNFEIASVFEFSNLHFEFILYNFELIFEKKYTFLSPKIIFFADSSPPPLSTKDFLRNQKRWNC